MHSNLMTSERLIDPARRPARWLLPLMASMGLLLWLPVVARSFRRPFESQTVRTQGRELRSDIGPTLFESPAPADLPCEPGLPDRNEAAADFITPTSPAPVTIPGGA